MWEGPQSCYCYYCQRLVPFNPQLLPGHRLSLWRFRFLFTDNDGLENLELVNEDVSSDESDEYLKSELESISQYILHFSLSRSKCCCWEWARRSLSVMQ